MRVPKNKPVLIGVTGGIGSGKSVVCKIFECLDVPVYYADDRAKWLMNNDGRLKERITQTFGKQSFKDGQLNRTFLAKNVFADTAKLQLLNQLVHPAVAEDGIIWQQSHADHQMLVKEAALLYETGSYKQLHYTLVVAADLSTRIRRVLARDPHRTEAEVREIISNQMPQEEKIKKADRVIINDEGHSLIDQLYDFLSAHRLLLQ